MHCEGAVGMVSQHKRELPWRQDRDAYRVWVSEIMLQQTRVAAVLDHYRIFLEAFPTVEALAIAPEERVLALWSGLGYYRRARMLHQAAKLVVSELGGVIPRALEGLRKLPGVGRYTASAIASIAYGEPSAVCAPSQVVVFATIAPRFSSLQAVHLLPFW